LLSTGTRRMRVPATKKTQDARREPVKCAGWGSKLGRVSTGDHKFSSRQWPSAALRVAAVNHHSLRPKLCDLQLELLARLDARPDTARTRRMHKPELGRRFRTRIPNVEVRKT